MKMRAEVIWSSADRCELGECPVWNAAEAALYWIDVVAPSVYRWEAATDRTRRFALPKPPASIFLGKSNRILVAMRGSFAWLDTSTGELDSLAVDSPLGTDQRFNDGRCDRHGDIWISTMDRALEHNIGSLICIDSALKTGVVTTGAKLGNGICFSPDNTSLYFSDTFDRTIYRYPLSAERGPGIGSLGPREVFVRLGDDAGRPDGCSVDSDGCLWSARVGGSRIDRYAPDGRLVGVLELPVSHPTHCAFGGPDLRTLFVTSSRYPKENAAFAREAYAGAVLAYDVGVQGLTEHQCAL